MAAPSFRGAYGVGRDRVAFAGPIRLEFHPDRGRVELVRALESAWQTLLWGACVLDLSEVGVTAIPGEKTDNDPPEGGSPDGKSLALQPADLMSCDVIPYA